MDLSKIYNPYDFANPVSDASLLVGRQKEMDEIKYYLDNARYAPRPINIALLGQRASGKTSILNITELEAKKRGFCTVRINLDEDDAKTSLAFFYKLFDSIFTEVCQSGAFGGINGETYDTYFDVVMAYTIPNDKLFCPFSFPIQYAKAMSSGNTNAQISDISFRNDLIKLHEELKSSIVILFDEGNVLAQSRVLLQKLRNIFMNTPGFMLVMTGTPDLFPLMDDVFSPIVRQFKKINVGEFRQIDDTRACIRMPLEKVGIAPEEIFDFETYQEVLDIHNLSGGRPYEIQLICHMLFRRVQSRRAETMKLDFSVLEEVRRELETWQDITVRPILTKVRNFSKKQLSALEILCSCDGKATFDQLWSLEYIFRGESLWTRNELEDVFRMYVNEDILKVDEDLVSFAGDDFDRIYTKYFAREQDITLSISSINIDEHWEDELSRFIDLQSDKRLEVMLRRFMPLHLKNAHITKLIADVYSANDAFVGFSPLSEDIYILMTEYQDQAVLPLIEINPRLLWLNENVYYRTSGHGDLETIERGMEQIKSLSERVAALGGNLAVERIDVPIIPLKILIDKVEHTANESARLTLARFHLGKMYEAYEKLNHEQAAFQADLVYRYDPRPNMKISNNLGYVFLGTNDFSRAEALFKRVIDLCQEKEVIEDAVFPALPIYNLGILYAECGQLEIARANFQACIDLVRNLNSEDRLLGYLWVPQVNNETLIFEEWIDPDILKAAETAKTAIERVINS